jgi:SAM-dependent methyltransferase
VVGTDRVNNIEVEMLKYAKQKVKKKMADVLYQILKERIDRAIEAKCESDEYLQIQTQLREFRQAPDSMRSSRVEALTDVRDLIGRFRSLSVPIREVTIDTSEFTHWTREYAEITKYYNKKGDVGIEKTLEHYLTMKFLGISSADICIDVAAASSPFADIISSHLNNKTYRQDLVYSPEIVGNQIGGDAGCMPVPDKFADVLTLHCAYECFQGDSDIRFIREAARVLKSKGRLGIVPLYVDNVYFVKTGPRYDRRKINVEKDARWIWRDDNYDKEPFSRHYSPEAFKERIIDNIVDLKYEILHVANIEELHEQFNGQRIYCNFIFKATKA